MTTITPQPLRRRSYIAPSAKARLETVRRVDRCCSLYYITVGGIYAVCQSAMVDAASEAERAPQVWRHAFKRDTRAALRAYDRWDSKMRAILADRYQLWLDMSDSVDDEMRRHVQLLFWSIDSCLLRHGVPLHRLAARYETARILLDFGSKTCQSLFGKFRDKLGFSIAPLFRGGMLEDILPLWERATDTLLKACGREVGNVNLNADANTAQAVRNITVRLTCENIYNRAGKYGLDLNPDMLRYVSEEDRAELEKTTL